MALFDLPLEELWTYLPERTEPTDFDGFWDATLREARALRRASEFRSSHPELRALDVMDVTFSGSGGEPIKGWLILPKARTGPLPVVVEFVGYGGGRGLPHQWLVFAAAGYAHFVMDTRGQGSAWGQGDTADPEGSGPQYPGFLTRGISDPGTYYYRRVFTDAVLAIAAVREHEAIDPERVVVAGESQGGGMTLAAAALDGSAAAALVSVPFLCHFRRALEVTDTYPYQEIRSFLAIHRDRADEVFRTLSYFDGVNFAARVRTPTLMSVGLMDDVCPPSTGFAAYNHLAGPKEIKVWPFNGHEAGQAQHVLEQLRFLTQLGIAPSTPDDGEMDDGGRDHDV